MGTDSFAPISVSVGTQFIVSARNLIFELTIVGTQFIVSEKGMIKNGI